MASIPLDPNVSEANPAFEITLRVALEDIDELGHVNNVNYLKWIQQVATAHWRSLAPASDQERIVWVVLRHEIDYKKPAFRDDEIVAKTWVGGSTRISFERHTEILRLSDRTLLARARTVWCPIDAGSRKPTPVSARLRELFSIPRDRKEGPAP
jgi:acyl-CoA thioester hydrolase